MSISQAQCALALLIRHPDQNRGEETETFLRGFDLDDAERRQLRKLAEDPLVAKYGRSMSGIRMETVEKKMIFSSKFLPEDFFGYLWMRYFEPTITRLPFDSLVSTFFDFVLENAEVGRELQQNAPAFIFDLIRFERAKLTFRPGKQWPPPSGGSLLSHTSFRIESFEYDVPGFIAGGAQGNPEPRKLKILFLGNGKEPGCRYFEIDSEVESFLLAQMEGKNPDAPLPPTYTDLVGLGLCREASL